MCEAGTFSAETRSTSPASCQPCPAGKYTSTSSMGSCENTKCDSNSYSLARATGEAQCVKSCAYRPHSERDANNVCVCSAGFFSQVPTGPCVPRPAGAECTKSTGCTTADFQLQPGFWRTGPASPDIIACPTAALCPQATTANSPACADGHTGVTNSAVGDGSP